MDFNCQNPPVSTDIELSVGTPPSTYIINILIFFDIAKATSLLLDLMRPGRKKNAREYFFSKI